MNYAAVLETYSLSELLELNDVTEEDILEFLVESKILDLPELTPLEFDE